MDNNHNPLNVNLSHEDIRKMYHEGIISKQSYTDVLRFSGIIPEKEHWRSFLNVLLMSFGTIFLLTGIIFFFAFNWSEMNQWQKFGGIEFFIVAITLFAWHKGVHKLPGKLAVLASGVLLGVLMAVYGQVYQTGADSYELFMYWGVSLLPLVVVTRLPAFWVLWLLIVNIALALYVKQGLGGGIYSRYTPQFLLVVNLIFLVVWNIMQLKKIQWMQEPWTNWIIAVVCIVLSTLLAASSIGRISYSWGQNLFFNNLNIAFYVAISVGFFMFFQTIKRDLFILAIIILNAGFLSFIVYFEFRLNILRISWNSGELLLIASLILLETSLAVMWLRQTHLKWSTQP